MRPFAESRLCVASETACAQDKDPTQHSGHHNNTMAICLLWFALACIDFATFQRLLDIMLRDKPDIMTCVMAYISNFT